MGDLRVDLNNLSSAERAYVLARSKLTKDKAAYEQAGIANSTFYSWPAERRDELNRMAAELQINRALMAEPKLNDAAEEAVDQLLKLMRGAKSEYVKLQAAMAVIERTLGPVQKRMDVTSDGEPIKFTFTAVDASI